jgi:hypothetical protein
MVKAQVEGYIRKGVQLDMASVPLRESRTYCQHSFFAFSLLKRETARLFGGSSALPRLRLRWRFCR